MISLTAAQRAGLTQHRTEAWRYDLLDLQDRKIGQLETVTGGSFDLSIHNTIRTGGRLSCTPPAGIDWLRVRIQPWYTATAGGQQISWPVGVFIPAAPGTKHTGTGKSIDLELYDKLLVLDQDKTEETYSVPAGTLVTNRVKELLASAGETRDAVVDSSETLRSPMVWEAGESKLRIVNDLLAAINYFSIAADGHGIFYAGPYVAPGSRGTAWTFTDDAASIYSPEFEHDADTFNVPNKYVAISRSDGEVPALTTTATNEDPASPYSYQGRGRWITTVETDVEATSQAVLNAIGVRRLRELGAVTSTWEVRHALIPIDLNDAVTFARQAEGIEVRAVIQKMTISTDVGALVSTTLREVS